jgi:hypothetical protein
MTPLASLLLNLAYAVAPKQDKVWLNDMRLEAPFVAGKLRFAFAALGLAFKFRFTTLKLNRPMGIAFASVAVAALATILFVPRFMLQQDTTNATMSSLPTTASEAAQDIALERGYSAEAQDGLFEAPPTQAEVPPADGVLDQAQAPALPAAEPQNTDLARVSPDQEETTATTQSAEATVAEVPPPAAAAPVEPLAQEPLAPVPSPQATTPAITSATGASVEEGEASPDAPATDSAYLPETDAMKPDGVLESATTQGNTPTSPATQDSSEAASAKQPAIPAPATPSVDTQVISTLVRGESVVIEVEADALLTMYRDTNFSGSPRINRYVTQGETFTANVPFSLYTDNAAAIKITADGKTLTLGEASEEQFRIFSKP